MTGKELLKKLKKLSGKLGVEMRIETKRGKGSHVTLYVDERYAIVPDLKKELKMGTLKAILKQIGVQQEEL